MIIYNGKNSFTDFDLYVASKEVPPAQLKEITESVPFMNGVWDFSFCNDEQGEYEPVTLKYTFDVIEDTKKDLNALKKSINKWLHSRGEQKLYDTDISTTEYYKVYNVKAGWSEEGLQGLVTVEFKCYPFMLLEKSTGAIELTTDPQTLTIENEGGRVVGATVEIASKNLVNTSIIPIGEESEQYNYISNVSAGSITISSKSGYQGNGFRNTTITLQELCPQIREGETYTLSANSPATNKAIYLTGCSTMWIFGAALKITKDMLSCSVSFYGLHSTHNGYGDCVITNIQIEKGTTATEYTPYIDANATIIDGVNSYALSAGKHTNVLRLRTGENTFNVSGAGLITVAYTEESY